MTNIPSEPEFEQAYKGLSDISCHPLARGKTRLTAFHFQSSSPLLRTPLFSRRTPSTRSLSKSLPSLSESSNSVSSGKMTRTKSKSTVATGCSSTQPWVHTKAGSDFTLPSTSQSSNFWASSRSSRMLLPAVRHYASDSKSDGWGLEVDELCSKHWRR